MQELVTVVQQRELTNREGAGLRGFQIQDPRGPQVTLWLKDAGTTACHVHYGRDIGKSPEHTVFFGGIATGRFYSADGAEWEELIDATQGPVSVFIEPNVHHTFNLHDDGMMILEIRPNHFDPNNDDTERLTADQWIMRYLSGSLMRQFEAMPRDKEQARILELAVMD